MNIVKIKNVTITTSSGLTSDQVSLFNEKFSNKYVYCVGWTYCIPFSELNQTQYIELCQSLVEGDDVIDDYDYLEYSDISTYVDTAITNSINSISSFKDANAINIDSNLPLLKKFRTWLATAVLTEDVLTDSDEIHVVKYYSLGMYDDIVKYLMKFGGNNSAISSITSSTCGCSSGSTMITDAPTVTLCDTVHIYKENIYLSMCKLFGDYTFWTQFNNTFLGNFKTYVDGIISNKLPLDVVDWTNDFVDCSCSTNQSTSLTINEARLQRLSTALQYLISNDINGHRNYIKDAFTDWATYLYENMEW